MLHLPSVAGHCKDIGRAWLGQVGRLNAQCEWAILRVSIVFGGTKEAPDDLVTGKEAESSHHITHPVSH